MLKCLIALTSSLATLTAAAQVWTWVDENGIRHYSDRSVDGATEIQISTPQTFSNQFVSPATTRSSSSDDQAETFVYTVLDFISPEDRETLFNIEGTLGVTLAVAPALRANHSIDLMLNGERVVQGTRNLTLTVPGVFRGEHTLEFSVVGPDGSVFQRAPAVTFFVRQNSIQAPAPANPAPGVRQAPRPN